MARSEEAKTEPGKEVGIEMAEYRVDLEENGGLARASSSSPPQQEWTLVIPHFAWHHTSTFSAFFLLRVGKDRLKNPSFHTGVNWRLATAIAGPRNAITESIV